MAFIQARMSSSRLPGKSLEPIQGRPMLAHVVERARAAQTLDGVCVVTSTDSSDDAIEAWCVGSGVRVVRGHLTDVLARFAAAAIEFEPSIVVRLTADCPLTDPAVIDAVVDALRAEPGAVYAASRMPDARTFPLGIDVEAVTRGALAEAAEQATQPYQREHVTPYFYDGSHTAAPVHVRADPPSRPERWTVDTAEDLDMVRELIRLLPSGTFAWREVARCLDENPELRQINQGIHQKSYRETQDQ